MTDTQEPKPKSYTTRLKEFLQENKVSKKTLDLISTFAKEESEKLEEKREATKGIMTFGKYKSKPIKQVYEIDPQYITWLQKNNKYLSDDNKAIVEELLSSRSDGA